MVACQAEEERRQVQEERRQVEEERRKVQEERELFQQHYAGEQPHIDPLPRGPLFRTSPPLPFVGHMLARFFSCCVRVL